MVRSPNGSCSKHNARNWFCNQIDLMVIIIFWVSFVHESCDAFQSEGVTDESKRQHMEHLVRDELERWDSESCIGAPIDPLPGSNNNSGRSIGRARPDATQVCIDSKWIASIEYAFRHYFAVDIFTLCRSQNQ